jgi:hypothetical protein
MKTSNTDEAHEQIAISDLTRVTGGDGDSTYDKVSGIATRIVDRGMQAAKDWGAPAMAVSAFATALLPKKFKGMYKLARAAGRYEHAAHAIGAAGTGVVTTGVIGAGLQAWDEIRGRGK